jgi:hypothetical protein
VAISISADRTADAQDIDLEQFATRALIALPGVRSGGQPSNPKPYDHRYDGVESKLDNESSGGVRQRISLIVLRRDRLVTFTVVVAANADRRARPAERLAHEVISTLRSQPPSGR